MSEFKFKVGDYVQVVGDGDKDIYVVTGRSFLNGMPHYKVQAGDCNWVDACPECWFCLLSELDLAHYFARKICEGGEI